MDIDFISTNMQYALNPGQFFHSGLEVINKMCLEPETTNE